uniref:Nuclear receptor n=1 Tax=Acrobeloides nanus TaxID=290746 RepID=A0A914CA77_9BILA
MISYLMNESRRYCGNSESQWADVFAQLGMQATSEDGPPNAPLLLNLTLMPPLQPKIEILEDDDIIGEMTKIECKYENFSPNNNSLASTSSVSGSISPNSSDEDFGYGQINSTKQRCAVCNDAATGFHYDTPSCNGCKTFFRRTVVTGRSFVCKKGGRCSFDKNGRCACRACRFAKCVAVGMNSHAIQYTPSANLTLSIARKCFMRTKKNANSIKQLSLVEKPIAGIQDEILRRIGHVLHLEEKFTRLRNSTFFPYSEDLTLNDLLHFNTSFGEAERYPLVEKWPTRPKDPIYPRTELVKMGIKFWYFLDLYLSVDYLKTFDIFHELSESDQITLCKAIAAPTYHLTNAYFSYLQRSEIVVYPDGFELLSYRNNGNMLEIEKLMRVSVIELVARMKMDQIQYSLLRAIVSLHDGCRKLSTEAREKLSEERAKYTKALLHYLQNKHGMDAGTKRFGDSLALLNEIFYKTQYNYNYYSYRKYVERTATPANLFADLLENKEKYDCDI